MMYQNMEIPILASNDTSKIEDETLRIRETNNLFFIHDESQMDKSTKEKFSELVKNSIHNKIELGVKCNVISIDKDSEIGGQAYPVRVRVIHKKNL